MGHSGASGLSRVLLGRPFLQEAAHCNLITRPLQSPLLFGSCPRGKAWCLYAASGEGTKTAAVPSAWGQGWGKPKDNTEGLLTSSPWASSSPPQDTRSQDLIILRYMLLQLIKKMRK